MLEGLDLAQPALALLGVLPGVEVAGVVEAEDYPVLIIVLAVARTQHF
jgi:hypothetical protein